MLNLESHYEHFLKLAKEGCRDVLHFTISSGLAKFNHDNPHFESISDEPPPFECIISYLAQECKRFLNSFLFPQNADKCNEITCINPPFYV